jgi:hypothetical protein
VADAVRQRLDEAIGPLGVAAIVFRLACAIRLQARGVVVDEELALPQLDAVARQSHHALDPGLRAVARPAEHDDVAALGRVAEQAAGFRQRDLDRQRRRAVAVGNFDATSASPIKSVGSIEPDGT